MSTPGVAPVLLVFLSVLLALPGPQDLLAAAPCSAPSLDTALFGRSNLVAWCIVPFDGKKRGPEERAAMLERLGFQQFAYDYRAEHVPPLGTEQQ